MTLKHTDTVTPLIELPFNLPGRIFRSPMPFGRYDPDAQVFEQYRQNGVQVVVLLAEREECLQKAGRDLPAFYAEHGLEVLHLSIPDFGVPAPDALNQTIETVIALAQAGKTIVAHCYAGFGRTGMFLACLARRVLGLTGEEAIQWVRSHVPTSIEMPEQIEVVMGFEAVQRK